MTPKERAKDLYDRFPVLGLSMKEEDRIIALIEFELEQVIDECHQAVYEELSLWDEQGFFDHIFKSLKEKT